MKLRYLRFLPQAFVVCVTPLLACSSALASVVNFNESSTAAVWTLPAGTNLLSTATPSPASANSHEGSSSSWAVLTDGLIGAAGENTASVTPNNGDSLTYALDLVAQPAGYSLTSFDAYGAWGDSGRDNLDFTIQYSTVADPTTFITLATISNHTGNPYLSTHTSLSDTSGFLATGVGAVRLNFANQENGYVGYREFILQAAPAAITSLNESNTTNIWTLPAGTNLLNGATATPVPTQPNHGGVDVASATWTTVTNNSVGTASNFLDSVTPNNQDTVTFPLDTSVNFNGYNIASFDSYCAWADSGRDNQDFSIRYSTVAAPSVFIPLTAVMNHTSNPLLATHTRLTPSTGFLATGVAAIQLYFNNQENGYTGYREFVAVGSAVSLSTPLTWTGGSGANWITGADSNWKQTSGGAASNYNSIAPLTFDSTGANRNISVPTALTASSLTFANGTSTPYTFGGQLITVSNDIESAGPGSATFNNALIATTGVTLSGAGSLAFNAAVQSPGMILSGTGGITLNAANPLLTGNVSVSNGTLHIANNAAMSYAALAMTGGTAHFTSAAPVLDSLAGTAGSIILDNTSLSIGDPTVALITSFEGNIGESSGYTGSLTKSGLGSLSLSGDSTYSGATRVTGGTLQLAQELALYNGITGSWTASNIQVAAGATLGCNVGSAGEFTDSDLNAMSLGGFQAGSTLGINATADFTLTRSISAPIGLLKSGLAALTLTGTNSYTGATTVLAGSLTAANPSGIALPGNVILGDGSSSVWLDLGASNQFGPASVLSISSGPSVAQGKVDLRGTNQVVAGLESLNSVRVAVIQNDETETGNPGSTGGTAGPASLTIHTTSNHSFSGIIRDQEGGAVSLLKTGPATQELCNLGIAGYGYTGATDINEGTLKLNFTNLRNTSWSSNIAIASGATFELAGVWNFFSTVTGQGQLVKSGTEMISLCNQGGYANANTYSGGTVIKAGILKFYSNGISSGDGNGPGQYCVAGPMDPSNVITVQGGATMGVGFTAALGNSPVLPQFAPTIMIEPGGKLWGGEGSNLAFIANLNFDGATVDVTDGSTAGSFNTNMTFVGTVVVGGVSTTPTVIATSGTGANANISLGSLGITGTIFQVADVTSSGDPDLIVSSILQDVGGHTSPLTKTGPGTMQLLGANTYTGDTTVLEGTLALSGNSIADANSLVINGGKVDVAAAANETVNTLYFGSTQQVAGTYGSTSSAATYQDDSRFSGSGIVTVTSSPAVADPYAVWSAQIADPSQRGRAADPDGDGLTNLQEYLFGTSPTTATGSLTELESTPSGLIVRWNQLATGTSVYVLRESATLMESTWPVSTATISDNPVQDLPGYVRKQALIPIDSARKFIRVEANE